MADENSKLVYSTGQKVINNRKGRAESEASQSEPLKSRQGVTVRLDRKSRGGKTVTIIEGLRMSQGEKEILLKQLKTRLGTGGSIKGLVVEVQGDHCGMLLAELRKMGCQAKRSGG